MRNFRIVILDRPAFNLRDALARELFADTLKLKIEGYGKEYPSSVLPIDQMDYIATHLLICFEDAKGRLTPFVGYKSITLKRVTEINGVFPPISILRLSGADRFELKVRGIIKSAEERQASISYDSSWTMEKAVREDKELSRSVRDVISTIGVMHHLDFGIPEWFVLGIARFKTDLYFKWMGHQAVSDSFNAVSLAGEPAMLMHLKEYSPEALQVAEKNQKTWENRLLVTPEELQQRKAA